MSVSARPADPYVTIVSEVLEETEGAASSVGLPTETNGQTDAPSVPPPVKRTYTTLVKGRKARRESSDGTVMLYDRAANKVYTILPKTRTYWVEGPKEAMEGPRLPDRMADRVRVATKIKLTSGTETEIIAGVTGSKSAVSGEFKLEPKAMAAGLSGGFPGGGRPRGGGFPGGRTGGGAPEGGGRGGGRPGGGMRELAQGSISGEVWTTEAAKLLGVGEKDARDLAFLLTAQAVGEGSPFLKPLHDQLSKKKAAPVSIRLTTTLPVAGSPDVGGQGGNPPSVPRTATVTITMRIIRVETPEALDDSLFVIPADYQKVEKPARQMAFSGGSGRPGGVARPVAGGA
jgi:hypothetical protein